MTKIVINDGVLALECIRWCINELGPVEESAGGGVIRSPGWTACVGIDDLGCCRVQVELTEHVDPPIHLLFLLKFTSGS